MTTTTKQVLNEQPNYNQKEQQLMTISARAQRILELLAVVGTLVGTVSYTGYKQGVNEAIHNKLTEDVVDLRCDFEEEKNRDGEERALINAKLNEIDSTMKVLTTDIKWLIMNSKGELD